MTDNKQQGKVKLSDIFQCTRCGYCCQGETTVSLDKQDQQRMIAKLGLSREEVRERYWRVTGNVVQMKSVDGHCIFYDEKIGCTVHEGRPWRCGQWPLHPSMLSDENNFKTISQSCPGINKKLFYEEFRIALQALLAEQEKLIC
ncbi:MAG: YkgJ family cysteine cluster protein [Desulfobulbaceae bacterium]|nr:YkgJ family cysteine cluster protein [Desulfobulbaceae bacterium]